MTEPNVTTLEIEVPDDSILASKQLTVRPIGKMRLKHLRAFRRVIRAGREADMDDMAIALQGCLIGWTEDEVNELTLDEMMLVISKLDQHEKTAIPNASGSSSPPRSAQTTRGRGRTGSARSS
jgi:hypothetical protein